MFEKVLNLSLIAILRSNLNVCLLGQSKRDFILHNKNEATPGVSFVDFGSDFKISPLHDLSSFI